jgi:hypothetical protein
MPAKRTAHIIFLVLITSYLATVKSTTWTSKQLMRSFKADIIKPALQICQISSFCVQLTHVNSLVEIYLCEQNDGFQICNGGTVLGSVSLK